MAQTRLLTGLHIVAAAVLGATTLFGGSAAQAQTTVRIAHIYAPGSEVDKGILRAAEYIGAETGGRYVVEVFPAGQFGNLGDLISQVMDGSLEATVGGPSALADWQPAISLLEAPFLARDVGHMTRIFHDEAVRDILAELRESRGLVVPAIWYYGFRHMTTTSVPIETPEDLQGLKFRVPPVQLLVDTLGAFGATPTPMAFGEVYLGLQTGVIDGQENPLPTIYNNKFHEVQSYLSLTGHLLNPLVPIVGADFLDGLPEEDRQIFLTAFEEGGKVNDALTIEAENRILTLMKDSGMTVIEPDRDLFRDALKPVLEKYESVWGEGVYARLASI